MKTAHSKEAEMAVLSMMMNHEETVPLALNALREDDFYFTEHRVVFKTLKNLLAQESVFNVPNLCLDLKEEGKLKAIGGKGYLEVLRDYIKDSKSIEDYIKIIIEKSELRRQVCL